MGSPFFLLRHQCYMVKNHTCSSMPIQSNSHCDALQSSCLLIALNLRSGAKDERGRLKIAPLTALLNDDTY